MAVTVFGASGRTGELVLAQALKRGWPVRALVRNPAKVAAAVGLSLVAGDARDEAAIESVIDGPGGKAGAVLVALGMHDITVPATDFSDSVKAIVAAMKRRGVRRIVAIASGGVMEAPGGGYVNQQPGFPDYLVNISKEHVRNYETLRDAGLDWTLMCPMTLVDDITDGSAAWAFDRVPDGSGETARADLARAMCDLLTERKAIGHRVGIVTLRRSAGMLASNEPGAGT